MPIKKCIQKAEQAKLEKVADYLREHPGDSVIAQGNTSWRGTTQYNLGLGDRRANAVKTYLVQLGVNADRVEILSLGELNAVQNVPINNPEAIKDRNVKIILVSGG